MTSKRAKQPALPLAVNAKAQSYRRPSASAFPGPSLGGFERLQLQPDPGLDRVSINQNAKPPFVLG